MTPTRNLGDPAYEPSDDELRELAHRAFAHIPARQEQALRELRERIARLREAGIAASVPGSPKVSVLP